MQSITKKQKKLFFAVTSAAIIAGGTQAAFAPTTGPNVNQCRATFDFARGPLTVDSTVNGPLCNALDVDVDTREELSLSTGNNPTPLSPSLVNQGVGVKPLDLIGEGGVSDEQREFEMKLGKAMDTLRKDYPDMLTTDPGTCSQVFNGFFRRIKVQVY